MTLVFKDMSAQIKAARLAKRLTQADLAALSGVSQQTIAKIEQGRIAYSRSAGLIASALGIEHRAPELVASIAAKPDDDLLDLLNRHVRKHGVREGLLDALLPAERQNEVIAGAMRLIETIERLRS